MPLNKEVGANKQGSYIETALLSASSVVTDGITAYARRYGVDNSAPLFTEASHGARTPILDALVTEISKIDGSRSVIEAGAGSGYQALHLATLSGVTIFAVEPNAPLTGIAVNVISGEASFGEGSGIKVMQEDVVKYLADVKADSIHGVHANSLVHFWDSYTRELFFRLCHQVLVIGGTLAISLKTVDDAQLTRGVYEGEDERGVYGRDTDFGHVRLFVSNKEAIARDLKKVGFDVSGIYNWTVNGYDFPGENASFVGFVGKKRDNISV